MSERGNVTFTGVLEVIGKGFEKGLQWAGAYAVPVEKLVGLLFPAAAPELTVLADATGVIPAGQSEYFAHLECIDHHGA